MVDGTGGIAGTQLMSRDIRQPTPPNLGEARAYDLAEKSLAHRQRYAKPQGAASEMEELINEGAENSIPKSYNMMSDYPAKYAVPTASKERMQARQVLRESVPGSHPNVQRTDPITEDEVTYIQSMKAMAEQVDIDRYISKFIDPRKPGNLKWRMEVNPGYVDRRIQQVNTDYEYALRNQMIDMWGMNSFDDIHFKYMVDNGKIDGPTLTKSVDTGSSYAPGLFSPWKFVDKRRGLSIPFTKATIGDRPELHGLEPEDWQLKDDGQVAGKPTDRNGYGLYGQSLFQEKPDPPSILF